MHLFFHIYITYSMILSGCIHSYNVVYYYFTSTQIFSVIIWCMYVTHAFIFRLKIINISQAYTYFMICPKFIVFIEEIYRKFIFVCSREYAYFTI